jgi:Type II restriction endonuclease, TdeIII
LFLQFDFQIPNGFYRALIPNEVLKVSQFEHRFIKQFGDIWEKLAVMVAQHGLGLSLQRHPIRGNVSLERLRRIQEVLNELDHPESGQARTKPNWQSELDYILAGRGEPIPVTVVCDIYAEDTTTKKRFAFEVKAPLPNSDQTKVSKEKLLKLYAMNPCPIDSAYYALAYNPYGQNKSDYRWGIPARWFDMTTDSSVLIGAEFWDKIGGVGTYTAFIEAINEIGLPYRERIYRDFLGIEPPSRSGLLL